MESSVTSVINLRHYHHGDLPAGFKQLLVDVHADAYADAMDLEFNQRFPWFVDHWSNMAGFTGRADRLRLRRTAPTRPRVVAIHLLRTEQRLHRNLRRLGGHGAVWMAQAGNSRATA